MERYRTTLILVVVLLALAGMAFFLQNRNSGAADATATPVPEQFVWEETDPVVSIDVISGTQTVSLRYDVSTTVWSIIEPVQDEADATAVGNAAESLKSLRTTGILTDTADLAPYGLDKPGMQVKLATGGAQPKQHAFQLGDATFGGANYYIKTPDSPNVYVVSNSIIEPIKSWLTTPPVAPPTPTPLPLITPTPTVAITGTTTLTGTVTVPATSTTTLGGSATITTTSPGAANPTTPLVPTSEASPTSP